MLRLMSHSVLKGILAKVKNARYYALIVDETTDACGKQQMSFTLRWVDDMLHCHEDFVGMYEVNDASAKGLFELIKDVLLRFELDVSNMRGQGYDRCSVMAGRESGIAARVKQLEPRAVFVHCSAHSMNLAVQEAAGAVLMIRDCLSLIHDLAICFKNSPTRSRILQNVSCENGGPNASLKPLFPTRWSVRAKSISSVLTNYAVVLESLATIATTKRDESGTKALGFQKSLERFETFFALTVALTVFDIVDDCNVSLQSKTMALSSAKALATNCVKLLKKL